MTKGIEVLDLVPGSHAERAGIKRGDQLLSVNGHEVNSMGDYIDAIKDRGNSQTCVVVRDGQELTIEMAIGRAASFGVN